MIRSDYDMIVMEYFDIHSDQKSLEILSTVNEADKSTILLSLSAKLYESIMDKVADIDFGTIPDSKGDITQIQNYDKLIECISTIESIINEFNQDKSQINTIKMAIENVIKNKDTFVKGFVFDANLPVITYNTIVLAIVSSVSLLISAAISFVSDAGNGSFSVKFDASSYNKSKDNVLFKDLARFNTSCDKGDLEKIMNYAIDMNKKNLMGVDTLTVVSVIAIAGLILNIIPIMRELIFFFFATKQSISDYFEIQSELIRINSEYVKSNTVANRTEKERKDIARKQAKIADDFNKVALATRVDASKASTKATIESKASDRKYKVDEIVNTETLESLPDTSSSIF